MLDDVEYAKTGLEYLGFDKENMHVYLNGSRKETISAFNRIKREAKDRWDKYGQ